ncbi:hypothetical protein SAMN04487935_2704 [Flavobacterium noncentrifugens]|uniref:Uncharacterized protein n=1 Tax=Flavobacterium noncentrifugens TaxID=1128970 RepID=A0A1G8ZTI2_9FLAO|nr:hypothetical protein SAMN04487935_2704 [Flavobacterium noncentrifugens]
MTALKLQITFWGDFFCKILTLNFNLKYQQNQYFTIILDEVLELFSVKIKKSITFE